MSTVKRGQLYRHHIWLDENHEPLLVKVFQVRHGMVWWNHAKARRSSTITDEARFLAETTFVSSGLGSPS